MVVDNRTTQPEALEFLDSLRGREHVRVMSFDAPFNYSAINNMVRGRDDALGAVLLNNDIEVIGESWLAEMVGHAMRQDIGAWARCCIPRQQHPARGVILGVGGGQPRLRGPAARHAGLVRAQRSRRTCPR